jgi:ABC-type lipoprotein release transport system permease subunit
MLWSVAWRNLWRHRTRTLIAISAVSLSYALMLVALGMKDDAHAQMLRAATSTAGGDVLVHGDGYWVTRSSDIVIPTAARHVETLAAVDGVRLIAPRIVLDGLASTTVDTRPVALHGVRPDLEILTRDVARHVVAGTFLEDADTAGLVLGIRLASRLGAQLGDRVVLTATAPDGEVTRALFHLTGILRTGTRELDEVAAYTTLAAAQAAFAMPDAVTQLGVIAEDGTDVTELAGRIEAVLDDAASLEVLTWREAVPEMVAYIDIDDALGYLFLGILYAIVLFSITNVFLMAVMERVREIGLLGALGMRGMRIGRLMLAEAFLMTALAMIAGLGLGFLGHLAISRWGVSLAMFNLEELEASGIDISGLVMRSLIIPEKWIVGSLAVAVTTVASTVYPAWRASRLAPAEAMRFYE